MVCKNSCQLASLRNSTEKFKADFETYVIVTDENWAEKMSWQSPTYNVADIFE